MYIFPELALSGSKNVGARTDSVFIPISQVCTRGVTLVTNIKIEKLVQPNFFLQRIGPWLILS